MDHTDNQLRACIKALDDVIGPGLAPGNAQAAEQLFLVTDYLKYLRSRLDLLHDRHRFEVRHYVTMAEAIADDARTEVPDAAGRLQAALDAGQALLGRADAGTAELRDGAAELAGSITGVLRAVGSSSSPAGRSIEAEVVRLSADKIDLDRAWHLPQGLDGDPASAPSLTDALEGG